MKIQNPIDRRSMLKGSVLGGAALAESLFGPLPDSARGIPTKRSAAPPPHLSQNPST